MKVFYLFSNWKWTGPAEPSLQLCKALQREGAEVFFFPGSPPWGDPPLVEQKAIEMGLECQKDLVLKKHLHPWFYFFDFWKLKKLLRKYQPDIIHTNLLNDHLLAALSRPSKGKPKIVRSSYDDSFLKLNGRKKYLLEKGTDFLLTISEKMKKTMEEKYPFLHGRIHAMEVGVDLNRFSLRPSLPNLRASLGFTPEDLVVGMVARIQTHRRFEIFLEAVRNLSARYPRLKVVIVGRGTRAEEVARQPVREMGLEKTVHFTGYLEGDDFVGALSSFDVKVLMVPGSDGSCRAVREAMAMGKGILAGRSGILPELLEKSQGGEIFDFTVESLEEKLVLFLENPSLVRKYGENALDYARKNFSWEETAKKVLQIYKFLL